MPITSIIGPPTAIVVPISQSTTSSLPLSLSTTSSTPISVGPAPSGSLDSSSPSLTSSPATSETTAAASSQVTPAARSQSQATPAGSIAGLVIGLLLLVGLVLFGVRWYFIRKRDHKTTPARSRISRLNISGPSNFTHLQSGAAVGMVGTQPTPSAANGSAAQMATPTASGRPMATGQDSNAAAASPYDRIKQKYSFDLNQLETGLCDHMETMKTSRKNAPSH